MPVIDKSPLLEASESLRIYREEYQEREKKKAEAAAREKASLEEQIYFGTRQRNEEKRKAKSVFAENLKNELLGDALKGIYIGALMENRALTQDGMALAGSLMDNYISEAGGATSLLGKMKGKSYILDEIRCAVEGTYEKMLREADEEEKDDEEDSKDDSSKAEDESPEDDGEDNSIEAPKEDDENTDDTEDSSSGDDETEDTSDDNEDEGSDDSEDNSTEDTSSEDNDTSDEGEDGTDDTTEDDTNDVSDDGDGIDGSEDEEEPASEPETGNEEMLDDLSKDEEINTAVEIIAKRVADAEEEFIKKNNEDKKAIEDIASKVSERINAAESDPSVSDEEEEEIKAEAARVGKIEENRRKERRSCNVYEQVVVNLTTSIVKDESLRESYVEDDGKLDMGSVMESAYCIYGLLETVNTLKLERVTPEYIRKALSTM